ncbi:hypothetical protein HK098_006458 [Nowakowskiella sp. JEL0407]|nr:hypothetical protein HK098_006458 [Nowakowskiella sp. JEL0407]
MEASNQSWEPKAYLKHAHFVPAMTSAVVTLLAPTPGERILDLGCGDGSLTKNIAQNVLDNGTITGQLVGVDGSKEMIETCANTFMDLNPDWVFNGKLIAEVGDGQKLGESKWNGADFDAVFTNAALHWMSQDPNAVVRGVSSVLKKGGRFVGEMGGHLNVLSVHSYLFNAFRHRGIPVRSPWYFPTIEEYSELLTQNGFKIEHIELQPRRTPLPTDVGGWINTFGAPFKASISNVANREKIWQEICTEVIEDLRPFLCDSKGNWFLDYVRLRFKAIKE